MTLVIIVFLFFLATLFGLATLYNAYSAVTSSPSFELKKRLRNLAVQSDKSIPDELRLEILRDMTPAEHLFYRFSLVRRLSRLIDSAGVNIDVRRFLAFMVIIALACFCLGMLLRRGIMPAFVLSVIGCLAPLLYLTDRKKKRTAKFIYQFPDALDMMSRALRSGHALSESIKLVGDEMAEPLAGLFKTAYDEQMLGLSLKDSLGYLLQRMPGVDFQLFVTAVNIHKEIGGNLAVTMERLANTIRERLKLRRQVKVYSAQARISGIILLFMPIVMALFFYLSTPGYIEELFTSPMGRYAVMYAVISQFVGFVLIKRIINIKI